jgi:hypothetical protein
MPSRPAQLRIEAGLTDVNGSSLPLTVELRFGTDGSKKRRKYVFSLLRWNRYNKERVFQLEVSQAAKPPKDHHSVSHQHYGEQRSEVPGALTSAGFDELLLYFCRQTSIEFRPPPVDPATLVRRER